MSATLTKRELAALSAPEAEAGLLHAVLAGEAVPDLAPEMFTIHRHRLTYQVIRELGATEPVMICRRLEERSELEAAGGVTAISALSLPEAWAGSAETCAHVMRECARRATLAQAGERLARVSVMPGGDSEAALADVAALADASKHEERAVKSEMLPPFPEIAWRGIFKTYRQAMDGTTEAPDVAHFATLWAVAGARLARRTWFYSGERTYPNVYICEYGDSGDKKTTAQRRAFNCGLLPVSGTGLKIIRNVGSTEGLADKLEGPDGDCGAFFFWEELSALLARGRWAGSTILEFLTETFDCPPEWGLDYRKKPIHLVRPTPTVLSATTTEWFWKSARAEDFYGGFGNRFLFLTGPKKAPIAEPIEPDEAALVQVRETLDCLSGTPESPGAGLHILRGPGGEARFRPDAKRLWAEFYNSIEMEPRPGLLGAALKRQHVYARKLCLVYAACERTLPEVSSEQLQAAIAVSMYAAKCTELLIDGQARRSAPEGELEERFTAWVKKNEGARVRYMQQALHKYYGTCETFNRVLKNLAGADVVEIRNEGKSRRVFTRG